MKLLTPFESNAKTAHVASVPVVGAILHLAPGKLSGYEVCPMRSAGCTAACLNTAGRGRFDLTQAARKRKTVLFFEQRASFMAQLVDEIAAVERKAAKLGAICAMRLNGTSDIQWEKIAVTRDGVEYPNLMAAFPGITFYDYTKIPNRRVPDNYRLTFSLSENNDQDALAELDRGLNVAVVLDCTRDQLPATWDGRAAINGDAHDFRFLDGAGGRVVGLVAKGDAKHDTTGFVRRESDGFDATRVRVLARQLERQS